MQYIVGPGAVVAGALKGMLQEEERLDMGGLLLAQCRHTRKKVLRFMLGITPAMTIHLPRIQMWWTSRRAIAQVAGDKEDGNRVKEALLLADMRDTTQPL